jgi:hypothetical protein
MPKCVSKSSDASQSFSRAIYINDHMIRPIHSGTSLDIFFFLHFFIFYIIFNLSDDVFKEKIIIFPIKWGKLVHGEVREFFKQKLIFPILCNVLGIFQP